MSKIKSLVVVSVLCGISSSLFGMIVDNRYFPLFPNPYMRSLERPSRFEVDLFFMTSDKGYGDREDDIGLPEIWGRYDQSLLSQAMVKVGLPSPLLDDWRGFDIKWRMGGKLQAQGVSFQYDQALSDNWSVGGSWLCMRSNSWQEFLLNRQETTLKLNAADELELEDIRLQMNQILGLTGQTAHQIGFGDIDLYVRYGIIEEYCYKFRRMDLGLKLGALIPSGVRRDQNAPASVPYGGDGFWGFYLMAEGNFELKEDLIFGIDLRVSKRFAQDRLQRMPLLLSNETQYIIENSALYGVLVTPVRINPGGTVMFSPYLALENIRAGLGARVQYVLTVHDRDELTDLRPYNKQEPPITQVTWEDKSKWATDYVILSAFYDFGKVSVDPGMAPVLRVEWDIPSLLFKAYNMSKTNKISIGLELHF